MASTSNSGFHERISRPLITEIAKPDPRYYEHTRFDDETSIRLLYLQPGSFDEEINVLLKVAKIDISPPYHALSYAWGPPPHEAPVFCHGKKLLVSGSCVAALRRLRHDQEERVLWIDAICIDQSSEKERGHQVKRMGDVYFNAQKTWIWLGEGNSESDFVMDLFEEYSTVINTYDGLSPDCRRELMQPAVDKLRKEERRLYGHHSDLLVESLIDRPWFERVWTVQEYALSRDSMVLCGTKSIPISLLIHSVFIVTLERRVHGGETLYSPNIRQIFKYFTEYQYVHDTIHGGAKGEVSFTSVLAAGRESKAADSKDFVFGLHGMLQKLHIVAPSPDYSKSIEDVFTEATRAAVVHDNLLFVLLFCSNKKAIDYLPSWVPDWSAHAPNRLAASVEDDRVYAATSNSPASFSFLVKEANTPGSNVVLCVTDPRTSKQVLDGVFLPGGNPGKLHSISNYHTIEAWLAVASKLSPYPAGETVFHALSHTLILGIDREPSWQQLHHGINMSNGFSHWLQSYRLGGSLSDKIDAGGGIFDSSVFKAEFLKEIGQEGAQICSTNRAEYVQLSLKRSEDAVTFGEESLKRSLRNVFFSTEGGYMGQGMPDIKAGDQVLLVAGVDRPLIGRKVGERYRLMGNCYVHGIMYGEKWHGDESELVEIMFE